MDGTEVGTLPQAGPVNIISDDCRKSGARQAINHQGKGNAGCVSSRQGQGIEGVRRLEPHVDSLHRQTRKMQSANLHVRANWMVKLKRRRCTSQASEDYGRLCVTMAANSNTSQPRSENSGIVVMCGWKAIRIQPKKIHSLSWLVDTKRSESNQHQRDVVRADIRQSNLISRVFNAKGLLVAHLYRPTVTSDPVAPTTWACILPRLHTDVAARINHCIDKCFYVSGQKNGYSKILHGKLDTIALLNATTT